MSLALTYIRRLTKKCHEQLYVYGLHSFDEMDFRDDNTLQIITILSNYWYYKLNIKKHFSLYL